MVTAPTSTDKGNSPVGIGLSVGSYVVAISAVVLVLSEILAAMGSLSVAFFDIYQLTTLNWMVLILVLGPPLGWLGFRLTKLALEAEKLAVDEAE